MCFFDLNVVICEIDYSGELDYARRLLTIHWKENNYDQRKSWISLSTGWVSEWLNRDWLKGKRRIVD